MKTKKQRQIQMSKKSSQHIDKIIEISKEKHPKKVDKNKNLQKDKKIFF